MTPRRIQRKRTKGWRMPEGAVYVGRPTPWGNPYRTPTRGLSERLRRIAPVESFRRYAEGTADIRVANRDEWLAPLRGRDLACWCPPDQPCHADVLLELANR